MPKHNTFRAAVAAMKPMTKDQHTKFTKAVKDGIITKKQHDNLPPQLLEAILKKKTKNK